MENQVKRSAQGLTPQQQRFVLPPRISTISASCQHTRSSVADDSGRSGQCLGQGQEVPGGPRRGRGSPVRGGCWRTRRPCHRRPPRLPGRLPAQAAPRTRCRPSPPRLHARTKCVMDNIIKLPMALRPGRCLENICTLFISARHFLSASPTEVVSGFVPQRGSYDLHASHLS